MTIKLPKARTTDILEQDAGKELLIYDLRIDKAYSLNETSAVVYKACSRQSFEELKREHKYSDELIYLALDELKKQDLLEGDYVSPFAGMNRREVIRKVGFASMIALPVISAIVAPTPASAASGRGTAGYFQPCQTTNDCAGTNTCQNSSNAQGGSSRVCCNTRFGEFDRIGPGVPAGILIFGSCNQCGSIDPVQEDRCCSQFRRYAGTCTPNRDGTVNCDYVCQ